MIIAHIQPDDAGDRIHWSDRREIRFYGGGDSETWEYELYSGIIKTDDELMERSRSLGVRIDIKDDKEKVFASGDLLVGVVT